MFIITNRDHNDSLTDEVKPVPVSFTSNQIGPAKPEGPDSLISDSITRQDASQHNASALKQPLVSCIMPTRNRRFFISQSIKYFLDQDYENKELIIIDDGDDLVSDIVPKLPNIFYYKCDGKLTIGEKRNIGCAKANGDLIAHWDDDDWFSNQRLSIQIKSLLASQSDICGFCNLYYYYPSSGSSWLYTYNRVDDTWIAGGTFVYKRDLWRKNNFPETNQAEDSIFLKKIQKNKILPIDNKNHYIGIIHTENTSAKYLDDPSWSRLPLSIVASLFSDDSEFYVDLRKAITNGFSFTSSNDSLSETITKKNKGETYQQLTPMVSYPLVSCIMPTSNRVEFVLQSINYFLRQTYCNSELIIIDDGDYPVENILPDDSRIKYVKLSSKFSIGKKRNLACEVADGDIIMCWDDDDWHGPARIEQQVRPLLNDNYDASGIGSYLYYSLINREFYAYRTEVFKDGIVGGTLTFWKRLWDEGLRFKNISLAEDVALQNAFKSAGARIKSILAENIFFIVRHDKNTWHVTNPEQKPIPVPEYIPLKDIEFYEKYSSQLNTSVA